MNNKSRTLEKVMMETLEEIPAEFKKEMDQLLSASHEDAGACTTVMFGITIGILTSLGYSKEQIEAHFQQILEVSFPSSDTVQ